MKTADYPMKCWIDFTHEHPRYGSKKTSVEIISVGPKFALVYLRMFGNHKIKKQIKIDDWDRMWQNYISR